MTKSLQMKGERRAVYNDKNLDCSVLHAFFVSLIIVIRNFPSEKVFLCWDRKLNRKNIRNFREELIPDYKGGRKTSLEDREDIMNYMQHVFFLSVKLGFKSFFPYSREADDCIAWISRNSDGRVVVVSSDKDLLQLVSPNVSYYNLSSRSIINDINFLDEVGIESEHFLLYKSILGDKSDNIRGLDGYGPVKSKKLARAWEAERENLTDEQIELVERNIQVMSLAENLEEEEEEAYVTQFSQMPTIDYHSFRARAIDKYLFSNRACDDWRNALNTIQEQSDLEEFFK